MPPLICAPPPQTPIGRRSVSAAVLVAAGAEAVLADLLAGALREEASQRPLASDLLAHAYFAGADAALVAAQQQEAARKGPARTCVVCLGDFWEAEGLACPQQTHFSCDDCWLFLTKLAD